MAFFLGSRQGEGQGGQARFQPGILHGEDPPGGGLPVTALAQDTRLQEEDLVEGQALAGGLQFFVRIGEMRLEQGRAQVRQPGRLANGLGQVVGQLGRPIGDDRDASAGASTAG